VILRLSDVIAGGAVGPGGGAPPVPPALAAVLPVPPVATLNVQPQLQSYRVKKKLYHGPMKRTKNLREMFEKEIGGIFDFFLFCDFCKKEDERK